MTNRPNLLNRVTPYIVSIVVLASLVFLPKIMPSVYWMRNLNLAMIYLICVLGLDISWGLCGQVSLGHAAFYGIGAYTSSLLLTKLGFNFWAALPFVILMSLFFGFVIGLPTLRLRAQYLALATIGFNEIFYVIMKNWLSLTNGPNGIRNIPFPEFFGRELSRRRFERIALRMLYGIGKDTQYILIVFFCLISIVCDR